MLFKNVKMGSSEEVNIVTMNLKVWHERLGHVRKHAIRELVKKGLVNEVSFCNKSYFFCEPSQFGKAHRFSFNNKTVKISTKPCEVFHIDACGLMSVDSLGGARFFLTFKEYVSSYRHVYFLRHKSNVSRN